MRKMLMLFGTLTLALAAGTNAQAGRRSDDALLTEIRRLATPAGGTIGLAVRELGSVTTIALNGDMLFPMATTFQLALAATLLHKVDRGELRLERMIEVQESARIESEIIADRLIHPGSPYRFRICLN